MLGRQSGELPINAVSVQTVEGPTRPNMLLKVVSSNPNDPKQLSH